MSPIVQLSYCWRYTTEHRGQNTAAFLCVLYSTCVLLASTDCHSQFVSYVPPLAVKRHLQSYSPKAHMSRMQQELLYCLYSLRLLLSKDPDSLLSGLLLWRRACRASACSRRWTRQHLLPATHPPPQDPRRGQRDAGLSDGGGRHHH